MTDFGRKCGPFATICALVLLCAPTAACYKCVTTGCEFEPIIGPAAPRTPPEPSTPGARPPTDSLSLGRVRIQPRPKVVSEEHAALFAALPEALRDVAQAQQRVHRATGSFTRDLALLFPAGPPAVVLEVLAATATGWAASATRPELGARSCVISFAVSGTPPRVFTRRDRRAGHTDPGTVMCDSGT